MRLLAVQLKRIGDLVLTTPALVALRQAFPRAHLALAVHESTAGLLPCLPMVDTTLVLGPRRGWTPWQQALTGAFHAVLDFTGNDRSALLTRLTRSPRRITYAQGKGPRWRPWMYTEAVQSPVREAHTVDHYLRLTAAVISPAPPAGETPPLPQLSLPPEALHAVPPGPYAVLHAGAARPEKLWQPERWAAVAEHLHRQWGLRAVLTGGTVPEELAHLHRLAQAAASPVENLAGQLDLPGLAAVISQARVVVSVDTAVVHIASAFRRPQVALFGPTNPFHWRPRHADALTLSAAQPEAPLTTWEPRLRGGPMDALSTAAVCRATDALLSRPHPGLP